MEISVQLYSVRDEIAKQGLPAVFGALKKAGIDAVESAGGYGVSNAEFKKIAEGSGLKVSGALVSLEQALNERNAILDAAATFGTGDIAVSYVSPQTFCEGVAELAEGLSAAANFYGKHGVRLGYHNHAHEFDKTDYLAGLLNGAKELWFEPDIFWLAVAGKAVAEYVKPYEDRLLTFHLKELARDKSISPNPVFGEGISEIAAAIRIAERRQIGHIVIETEGMAIPFGEYLKRCADYIRAVCKNSL